MAISWSCWFHASAGKLESDFLNLLVRSKALTPHCSDWPLPAFCAKFRSLVSLSIAAYESSIVRIRCLGRANQRLKFFK
jgi:hypothetical protein